MVVYVCLEKKVNIPLIIYPTDARQGETSFAASEIISRDMVSNGWKTIRIARNASTFRCFNSNMTLKLLPVDAILDYNVELSTKTNKYVTIDSHERLESGIPARTEKATAYKIHPRLPPNHQFLSEAQRSHHSWLSLQLSPKTVPVQDELRKRPPGYPHGNQLPGQQLQGLRRRRILLQKHQWVEMRLIIRILAVHLRFGFELPR